jgi:hypothetical protein
MMKYLKQTQFLGVAILLSSILFSGCMSEDTTLTEPLQPEARVELKSPSLWPNPLENLRMDPGTLKMLADLRKATTKYHDIETAMEDGYVQGSGCVAHPDLGGMGYHFVKDFPFDGIFDPTQPEALLYEKDHHGNMHLVGVEFVIREDSWEGEDLPYFGSKVFDIALAPDPLPFDNYQLHAWVWKGNPNGIFTMFNPNVKCNSDPD